jgi:hypothetical protein
LYNGGVTPAVAAILEGMPEPADLRLYRAGDRCVVTVGSRVLFDYDAADAVMRNVAICALRQLGFAGRRVAGVFGLTENYVATLHAAALREGSAALARGARPGPRGKLAGSGWERAAAWRGQGVSDAEIGRRLGVANTTVMRRLGPRRPVPASGPAGSAQPEALFPEPAQAPVPAPRPQPVRALVPVPAAETETARAAGLVAAGARIIDGQVTSRYAGAMLLHAFLARAGAASILAAAAGDGGPGGRQFADAALLSATSIGFALGAATVEQFKHLTAQAAGPLAGLTSLPDARTLRPRLAEIADGCDPLELQALFAAAMLAADPVTSGVYYVDDHFVPYTGAKPVGKGWNNKRGKAEKGRADTHVTAHDGRAVCFVSGEPSGLTVTLPLALAELKKAAPAGTAIMLGFDRGGAYPQVFRHCRKQKVHWVTYRRAPLAVPKGLPVVTTITAGGRSRVVAWAEETADIKEYGQARQITLFEHGQVALQILTSDFDACPAGILSWLRSRWREENFLKYASANYGIDAICDYAAAIETNAKVIGNPARKAANAAVRQAEKTLAAAREDYAAMLADPAIPATVKNTRLIPAAERKTARAERDLSRARAARGKTPAKLPANQVDPHAQVALLRAARRSLQMVLRLLAHNAEHWLSAHLNAYLRDDDEYRAITRETIIRGLAGTITYTPRAITVRLDRPGTPRVALAVEFLLQEINAAPPNLPGDTRPITYQLAGSTPAFNS